MKKRIILFALLLVGILTFGRAVYPWGSASGDGQRADAIRETAVFFNNRGATINQGSVVVVDRTATEAGSGATLQQAVVAGTTMGAYITTTTTADASGQVGVVIGGTSGSVNCGNQEACIVVTKGPVDTLMLDAASPDAVLSGDVVSTTTTAGFAGHFDGTCNGQSNSCVLGQVLEDGDGTDTGMAIVYVNPQ